jgi:hypothetical protein
MLISVDDRLLSSLVGPEDARAEFLRVCAQRIASGESKYGPVRSDARNRCAEALEELFDAYNYLVPIMLAKHPGIKNCPEWSDAVFKVWRAYRAVKKLQAVELKMEAK